MGGELIEAVAGARTAVAGALEATTSGLHRIGALDLAFPVFDWNGIALKDSLPMTELACLSYVPAAKILPLLKVPSLVAPRSPK